MKKIFSIFVMLLIVTVCCFAQKANVKKAYSKSEALFEDNPDYTAALDLIEPALQDETTKNDPYTWWVAAHIYDRMIGYEMYKQTMGQSSDNELMQEAAYKAYDYYLKAVELEKIPNAKGKVSDKYTKKAVDMLIWFYNNGLIANYGETQRKYENYEDAIKAYEKHLAIPDLQFIKDSKFCSPKEGDNCPKKNNEIYWNVKFIVAICTQLSGDNDNAITKYEAIKDKGYEENKIYQQLYYLYR
ncbi:MAG: hypothetical protein LBB53_01745 [Prevotellaceae bacterium]|jgi:tetratricopeptide (TPR) repeat protein|nr:hypothetical protein [Prevotellaceae bacterium]